jgi:flagellar biosynthesis protein FlhG
MTLAIAGEKGCVGKTSVVANLAFALAKLRKKALVTDADLGLGNLDLPLGLTPHHTLEHSFLNFRSLPEIIIEGPGGWAYPGRQFGVQQLAHLPMEQNLALLAEIDSSDGSADVGRIDTGAGIAANAPDFALAAQEILVVTFPKPMAVANPYAFMKVLVGEYSHRKFQLLVNNAPQCSSQPCVPLIRHGDLRIASDNHAKRSDSIFLAAAVSLKDEPWEHQ